jgi:hypothetical protein
MRVSELLEEIRVREDELEDAIKSCETKFLYQIEGAKVKFEDSVKRTHRELKIDLITWLKYSSLRNTISAPVIYTMIFPFILLDITILLYQMICFPLYRIPKVERTKYIVIDRHRLEYLNSIEKLNCMYCGYINGLIAYCREIVARTEQYWCPIKHAKKVLDSHRRYPKFSNFGDPKEYHQHIKKMRELLINSN